MYTKKDGFANADFDPKTVLTIPNIVTIIRLLILPFVLVALSKGQNVQAFILILVAGYGGVSITLRKIDTEGDLLVLTGTGVSSRGIAPVFKFGITEVTLTEAVEIGDEHSPYGLLWILSWVDSHTHNPPYNYTLVLSF